MNLAKIVWGCICFALAVLLSVLNVVLPPEKLMFKVGDTNMPWVPPVILALVGIVLLTTAGRTQEDAPTQAEFVADPNKVALNKRMEGIAWGSFLIMLGGFMFIPDTVMFKGFWSIGIGLIMLGLNAARYSNRIKMSGLTTMLGTIVVVSGLFQVFGMPAYDGAILIIVLGAYLVFKPWLERQQLFGRAEQS